ncbi:hypothetical protein EW146_g8112 [Bondarzewia mesenterica]|uniref:SAP domain-containing protein n=1 Tax=Bondarzewia mesenterica TaxID=1095465 RepID=A0A4S4LIW1_9AGAM|nr:hypothetical protein EW146_g8112 [Bondarzewia mesenterica]
MPKSHETVSLTLPKIVQALHEGADIETETVVIDQKFTKKEMKHYLKAYRIPCKGKRDELIQRLRDYAESPEQWTSCCCYKAKTVIALAEARRGSAHAPVRGAACSPPGVLDGSSQEPPQSSVSELPGGPEPENQIIHSAEHRRVQREVKSFRQLFETRMDTIESLVVRLVASPHSFNQIEIASECAQQDLEACSRPASESSQEPAQPPSQSIPEQHHDQCAATQGSCVLPTTTADITQPIVMPSPESQCRVLYLGSDSPGDRLEYQDTDLRDPPSIVFSGPGKINELLDEWYRPSKPHIVLGGRAIPIRVWDQLYMKTKGAKKSSRAWDAFRMQWHNWKYIVEAYEALGRSKDAFWARFRKPSGEPMNYQAILDALQQERSSAFGADAADARHFFGDNLQRDDAGGVFTYRKCGAVHVVSKDKEVAVRWCKLLADEPAIRERWEACKAERNSACVS